MGRPVAALFSHVFTALGPAAVKVGRPTWSDLPDRLANRLGIGKELGWCNGSDCVVVGNDRDCVARPELIEQELGGSNGLLEGFAAHRAGPVDDEAEIEALGRGRCQGVRPGM